MNFIRTWTGGKTTNSKLLNRMGAQVFRVVAARLLYNSRSLAVAPSIAKIHTGLKSDGYALWPDFLPDTEFKKLEQEALAFIESSDPNIDNKIKGPNTFRTAQLSKIDANKIPEANKLANDSRILQIMEAANKTSLRNLHGQFEYLIQGTQPDGVDLETMWHSDYFANTYKCWLFITDVELEHGPFAYFPKSQNLTVERLKRIYQESCNENAGSRRITKDELDTSKLAEKTVTVRKNTLVVVNTHGFHRRCPGKQGQKRLSIGFSARVDPFLTYLLPSKILGRLEDLVQKDY